MAAAGRGGGNDGGLRQHANSAAAAPGRRSRGRGTRAPASGASGSDLCERCLSTARSVGRGQASGSGASLDNNADDELEDEVEQFASSGSHPVSQATRAQWNDANNASMLELCIVQRRAGMYNGAQMTSEGYQAVVDGLLARRGLVYSRMQVNQLVILKNTRSFWRYLQVHTGLGRNPDGSIDAESVFWKTHTKVQCSLPNCALFYYMLTSF